MSERDQQAANLTPEDEAAALDTFMRERLGIEPPSPDALAAARASGLLDGDYEPGSEPSADELLDAFWRQHLPPTGGLG